MDWSEYGGPKTPCRPEYPGNTNDRLAERRPEVKPDYDVGGENREIGLSEHRAMTGQCYNGQHPPHGKWEEPEQ